MLRNDAKSKEQLIDELTELQGKVLELSKQDEIADALKESEWKLSSLIKNTPIAAIEWNLDFEVVEWNAAAEVMFGYTKEEALGSHAAGLIVPESAKEHVDRVWNDLMSGSGGSHSENNNITKDGRTIICDWNNNALTNNAGIVSGAVSLVQDITERKQTEEALKDSEKKYRTLFEQSADAVLIIDGDQFVDCNSATVKLLGYKNKKELLETHPSQLSPEFQPDGRSSFTKANEMMAVAFAHGSHRFEWDHKRHNGENFPVEVLLTAVPSRGKDFLHVVWRDITERKRLEELESRAARLDTAGTIAGQVAHDFNNLLGPLISYPEFIREELPEDHPALRYLEHIENSAQKIADINQQLLSLGRRGHYNQDALNLNTVIHQSVKDIAPLNESVTFDTSLDPELMNIVGGGSQIHRAITNLLYNAIDSMQGAGHIKVTTENYYVDDVSGVYGRVPKGEYVKLTISDTGCGISDEIVQRILDPFFTTKISDRSRGSGLGLSVVDAVVKDHGGYLDLESRPGMGASFYLYFPVTCRLLNTDNDSETVGGVETVLVIDDDEMQRKVSINLLSRLGYEASAVESGEVAVEYLKETPQDLLVLDMVMPPGIDGTETYRRVLKINPDQKAILASGFSESKRVREAQELGAGTFVKKPLTKKSLALAVRKELDRQAEISAP